MLNEQHTLNCTLVVGSIRGQMLTHPTGIRRMYLKLRIVCPKAMMITLRCLKFLNTCVTTSRSTTSMLKPRCMRMTIGENANLSLTKMSRHDAILRQKEPSLLRAMRLMNCRANKLRMKMLVFLVRCVLFRMQSRIYIASFPYNSIIITLNQPSGNKCSQSQSINIICITYSNRLISIIQCHEHSNGHQYPLSQRQYSIIFVSFCPKLRLNNYRFDSKVSLKLYSTLLCIICTFSWGRAHRRARDF